MPIQPRTNAPVASKDCNNHKEDKLPSQARTLSASIRKPNASDDTSSESSWGSETSDSDCADQLSSSDESDTAGLKDSLKSRKYNNAKAAPQNCLWRSYSSAASLKNRTASQEQKDLLAHQGISSIRRG
ncbi:hypothetical protein QJS10_CPB12g01711 [Acorus calamus]|uniref:Uncharacterized protein n=1 Tax=Acorus calamus TaxID=4465 RepID=A0AAV9DME2_ACOCL|nr:hypothetical protein QJS10_CPB12g01711 [Acorus calamus]